MRSRTKIHSLFTIVLTVSIVLSFNISILRAQDNLVEASHRVEVAPANDNFAAAQTLVGISGTVSGSNISATKEASELPHARNRGGSSVWYKYVAAGDGILTVDTTGSTFDTTIAVYKGSALSNLQLIAANDDNASGSRATVTFGMKINDVFYIAVDGFYNNVGVTATGTVQLNYTFGNLPTNDNFASARVIPTGGEKLITATNFGATREAGEPTISGVSGGKSLWFKWTSPALANRSYTFTVESADLSAPGGVQTLFALYDGTTLANLDFRTEGGYRNHFDISVVPQPNETFYLTLDGNGSGSSLPTGTFTISLTATRDRKMMDFDKDGRADIGVFRPSDGTWYSLDSVTGQQRSFQFGTAGDKPALGDFGSAYGSDGFPDYAVFRPSTGAWYVQNSETGFQSFNWGLATDTPMIDHSSDTTDVAVFRPSTDTWYEHLPMFGKTFIWGLTGDIPMYANPGGRDYDSHVIFRPSNGVWYVQTNGFNEPPIAFGMNGDKPVMADYDGDGFDDVAVFRPSDGNWYIQNSSDGSFTASHWGQAGDIPQPADYDGDGRADLAVFRNGDWYIRQSTNGTLRYVHWGLPGDIPVSSQVR